VPVSTENGNNVYFEDIGVSRRLSGLPVWSLQTANQRNNNAGNPRRRNFYFYNFTFCLVKAIVTCYGLDGPGFEPPVGARFFGPIQTGAEALPSSCTVGTGRKAAGAWALTSYALLASESRKGGAIPLPPLCAYLACSATPLPFLQLNQWRILNLEQRHAKWN
jgi:hypothetical protein